MQPLSGWPIWGSNPQLCCYYPALTNWAIIRPRPLLRTSHKTGKGKIVGWLFHRRTGYHMISELEGHVRTYQIIIVYLNISMRTSCPSWSRILPLGNEMSEPSTEWEKRSTKAKQWISKHIFVNLQQTEKKNGFIFCSEFHLDKKLRKNRSLFKKIKLTKVKPLSFKSFSSLF